MLLTVAGYRGTRQRIYNSRNFICIYTLLKSICETVWIYDSRNFICIYNLLPATFLLATIYDSRNFICIYNVAA